VSSGYSGEADHVHLRVNFPPAVAISRLASNRIGVPSRRLRQEFPGPARHYWRRNGCGPGPTSPPRGQDDELHIPYNNYCISCF